MNLKPWPDVEAILPVLSTNEKAQLERSIRNNGIKMPLLVMEDGRIIDGHHRWRIASKLDISPDYEIEHCTDEEGFGLAIALNISRRQMTAPQIKALQKRLEERDAKKAVAKALREQGYTQAGTAEEVGVAQPTIALWEAGSFTTNISADISCNPPDYRVKIPKSAHEHIYERSEAGATQTQIAADYKVAQQTISKIVAKVSKARERQEGREAMAQAAHDCAPSDHWQIFTADMQTWTAPRRYDFLITDPPYPRKYLSLYESLARRAVDWLLPGGLLIAMCGQSYLYEIITMMSQHLAYYWTAAYLTPGQPTPLRQRQVNTTWKPLLMFILKDDAYNGKIFGDVYTSPGREKDDHEWEQSVVGMSAIIDQVCLPGQWILDPFSGAGTTGIAALNRGCLFHGVEIDESSANICRERLVEYDQAEK